VQRRILLLITDLQVGGTPAVVKQLALALHADPDFDVQVACLDRAGPVAEQISSAGIGVTSLNARGNWDVSVISGLVALARREKIDTIFSFLIHANTVATAAGRFLAGVRFFQSIQTTQPDPTWHWALQSVLGNSAEKIIVPSPSVAAAAVERSQIPPEKIVVIPNAVDVPRFAAINIQWQGTRVGFLGRLDPVKRVEDLVEAMALVPPPATLEIFGRGPARGGIDRTIDRVGLRSRITLHGSADPTFALGQMDILVLPSQAEGFGLVLIEAMAAGVPVIGTDVPGIRDVIEHEVNGLLVSPQNPAALAHAIQELRSNEPLRARLIDGGKKTVREKYDWTQIYPRYRALLL
jgi:glycosyltransferase involved in cell wall biosynthesis